METVPHQIIAMDGPAASGKSSVARLVAERFGWVFVNSGNLYRAATLATLKAGVEAKDAQAVSRAFESAVITVEVEDGCSVVKIDGITQEDALKSDEVNAAVSHVATVPSVREKVVGMLRAIANSYDVVMEGRDIGTVVFPQASAKFYIDASPEIRAKRRGMQGETDAVTERDRIDASRAVAPLRTADDAIVIDSSHLTLEQVVAMVVEELEARGATRN